jgi:predicted metal-dependent peptidase
MSDTIQRIKKVRAKLFQAAPGAYTMMGGLPIQEIGEGTMATDGATIYANPEWVAPLSDAELAGVIIHEAVHVSNLHHTRRGDIHPELWNIACDMVINEWIKQSANYGKDFVLPDNGITWPPNHKVLNSKFDGSAERVCKILIAEGWQPPPPPPEGESPKPTEGCVGKIMDAPECEGTEAQILELEQEIMERVEEAALMERSMGLGDAGMSTKVKDSNYADARALSVLKKWLAKSVKSYRSFKRPNKRWLSRDIFIPTPEKRPQTLYCVIDSSASMGLDDFDKARETLVATAKRLRLSKIMVAYVDRRIHINPNTDTPWWEYNLRNGQGAECMELDIFGGGGTSFTPIFTWLKENRRESDVAALVYFTDGMGSVTCKRPPYPVLWATTFETPTYNYAGQTKVFGTVIKI